MQPALGISIKNVKVGSNYLSQSPCFRKLFSSAKQYRCSYLEVRATFLHPGTWNEYFDPKVCRVFINILRDLSCWFHFTSMPFSSNHHMNSKFHNFIVCCVKKCIFAALHHSYFIFTGCSWDVKNCREMRKVIEGKVDMNNCKREDESAGNLSHKQ